MYRHRGKLQLFRSSAVNASLGTQIGEIFASHWRGVAVFTALAFGLTAALLISLSLIEYSPAYRVPCYTDTQAGFVRMTAPIDGQVGDLAVTEGSSVKRGDLLAVLSTDKFRARGDSQRSALAERLRSELATVDREIDAASREATANHEMIARRIAGLKLEWETSRAESHSAEQLLTSLHAQVDQFVPLVAQGYVSRLQLTQKRDEVTLQESRAASSKAALKRIERDIATSEAEHKLIDARFNEVVENRHRAAEELERLSVQSDVDSERVVRAPMDGIVSTALIVSGQSVEQGQALFSITPFNAPLITRLLVPARAVAAVKSGMDIRFALRAYPREKFGTFGAHILSMSETPALPGDVTQVISVTEASFVAVAGFPAQLRGPDGRLLQIKPGMVGEAFIPLERRSILQWILDPILRGINGRATLSRADSVQGRLP